MSEEQNVTEVFFTEVCIKMISKGLLYLVAIGLWMLAMVSCVDSGINTGGTQTSPREQWLIKLKAEVANLGARNWILVTEKAFPLPKGEGVRVIDSKASLPDTLLSVFDAIESEGHIRPRIYRLREFNYIQEEYAPGIEKLRDQLLFVLAERTSQEITKKTAETLLDFARREYRVLIVKSNSAYPYSSLFMELDTGYWNGVSEDALREIMRQ